MMANLAPLVKFKGTDDNGGPLSGGKLYTYLAGTSTPLATYTSQDESAFNTNPIILNARGEADVWLGNGTYKFVLKDADDNTIWTKDLISSGTTSSEVESVWTEHAVTDGQAATDLEGETLDLSSYSSAIYEVEILRGTTVLSNGRLAIQGVNSTGRVVVGGMITSEAHGVTFSVSQTGTVVQLKAALNSGAGDGTIKLSRRLIPA